MFHLVYFLILLKNKSPTQTLKMYDKKTRKKIYNLRKKYKNI